MSTPRIRPGGYRIEPPNTADPGGHRGRLRHQRPGFAVVTLTLAGLLGLAAPAGATPSPSPSWPEPGTGVGQAQSVTSQVATVRPVQRP